MADTIRKGDVYLRRRPRQTVTLRGLLRDPDVEADVVVHGLTGAERMSIVHGKQHQVDFGDLLMTLIVRMVHDSDGEQLMDLDGWNGWAASVPDSEFVKLTSVVMELAGYADPAAEGDDPKA